MAEWMMEVKMIVHHTVQRTKSGILLRILSMLCLAALAVTMNLIVLRTVIAQQMDQQLIAQLVELTKRKGSKDFAMLATCEKLGVQPIRQCEVFQAAYDGADGFVHAFNTYVEPRSGITRIIIFKSDRDKYRIYLTGLDAKFLKAVGRDKKSNIWITLPNNSVSNEELVNGFSAELSYWRAQLPELEKEPDRKN